MAWYCHGENPRSCQGNHSPARQAGRITKGVPVKIGPYRGKMNLTVVIIYDFKLILVLEFLREMNIIPWMFADVLLMFGANGAKSLFQQ